MSVLKNNICCHINLMQNPLCFLASLYFFDKQLDAMKKGLQTIIIPIGNSTYHEIIECPRFFKDYLDKLANNHPELFPRSLFEHSYQLDGFCRPSEKIDIARRVIRIQHKDYIIHPCFIMPYLRGNTVEVSKGLELRKYNVPYHVLARTKGRDAMYWYRAEMSLAQNSIVGTSIKFKRFLPAHIAIDEHHDSLCGQKIYIPTTVGHDCILGVGVCKSVSYESLKAVYRIYMNECKYVDETYCPQTVNTDGFGSTVKSATAVYPQATIIRCFLHGFLKIKTQATKKYLDYFEVISAKVWGCYDAKTAQGFAQRIRRLEEWTNHRVPQGAFKTAVLKLCQKKRVFKSLSA